MIINPKIAIEKEWIKGIRDEKLQVQPNAIDFTLDHLYEISEFTSFIISTDRDTGKELKQMRKSSEVFPVPDRSTGKINFYHIDHGSFDITSDMYVSLPEGVAALLIIRSTFNRNGIFLTSGLYDSGYQGHIGCVLHHMVKYTDAVIEQGIRVGQIIFVEASNAGMYTGSYNHKEGEKLEHRTGYGGPK